MLYEVPIFLTIRSDSPTEAQEAAQEALDAFLGLTDTVLTYEVGTPAQVDE